ncbi:hypothetical protein [Methylobacterium sp. AMS5]|uniref:hypothetical protein n=1 Tax=Methylobacterium sp. AMS5 TaxID=925818 RepID=UPI00074F8B92|nr:hypothetical protein [Methylobacterium sp. AMS5]AMB48306.1 hypothetical protein Y590_25395 [Methylobacterium sp. AMS5]
MQNQDTITRMLPGERIIEQTDAPGGQIAQTIQRLDGSDYVRLMPGTVTIDLRTLQTLLDVAEAFDDIIPEDVIAEFDAAMEQAREALMQPELPNPARAICEFIAEASR